MYDENQLVKIKWNNTNRKHFEDIGYKYTKRYDEFYVKAKELNNSSRANINVTCDYCGNNYTTQYNILYDGRLKYKKDCCSKCAVLKASETSRQKRADKYINMALEICVKEGYELITSKEDYVDVKMGIVFMCSKHGLQTMMLDNFIRGCRCYLCGRENVSLKKKKDIKEIKANAKDECGSIILNPEEYIGINERNLKVLCSCGKIYTTSYLNFTKYGVVKCHSCASVESSGEKEIRNILEKLNVNFVQEKRFNDCRDKKPLPFDFYLPDYNLIIEFDGQHHFSPIRGEENFYKTITHDDIKNKYCKDNNIDILRIPYYKGKEIEKIILDYLKL